MRAAFRLAASLTLSVAGISAFAQMPQKVLQLATERYVNVQAVQGEAPGKTGAAGQANGDINNTVTTVATGVRIGGRYVLINFHALQVGSRCVVNGFVAKYVKIAPELDLVLVEVPYPSPVPWLTIADAKVGEYAYGISNADGIANFAVQHFISKVDNANLYFENPTIPGESGTGYFDRSGDLIGFARADMPAKTADGTLTVPYSIAIPASTIRKFLQGIIPEKVEDAKEK